MSNPSGQTPVDGLLQDAATRAISYLEQLDARAVAPSPELWRVCGD